MRLNMLEVLSIHNDVSYAVDVFYRLRGGRVFKCTWGSACAESLDIAACRGGVQIACAARNRIAGLSFRGACLHVWRLVFLNDSHDVRIPTLTRERQRSRRLPIRIDAAMRVGAVCHEHPHYLDVAIDDGVVQWAEVVRALVREFGPQAHGSDPPAPVHASDDPVFKKLDNLKAAVSVFVAWYKLRVHHTLGVTPAMEAGSRITSGQLKKL